ncbi:hypothetical protein ACU5P1_17200 [Pseudomonas plecoglossicida]|uniref:hypothetical protein n=1 Tax=Pseudomonas plecoglossicida TaxID=70775 RepID=UPI001181F86A|nr:hypothetical protein [Pseudomonas plecoglossicida]QLB56399.1 hypothetical protein HAV28_17030 [Pseudomonas plecoglossicida]
MLKRSFLYDQDILIIPKEPQRHERLDGSTSSLRQAFVAVRIKNNEIITSQELSAWNFSQTRVKNFFNFYFNLTTNWMNWDVSSPEYGATWQHSNFELFFGSGNPIINYTPAPSDQVKPKAPKFNLEALFSPIESSRPLKMPGLAEQCKMRQPEEKTFRNRNDP